MVIRIVVHVICNSITGIRKSMAQVKGDFIGHMMQCRSNRYR